MLTTYTDGGGSVPAAVYSEDRTHGSVDLFSYECVWGIRKLSTKSRSAFSHGCNTKNLNEVSIKRSCSAVSTQQLSLECDVSVWADTLDGGRRQHAPADSSARALFLTVAGFVRAAVLSWQKTICHLLVRILSCMLELECNCSSFIRPSIFQFLSFFGSIFSLYFSAARGDLSASF